MDIYTDKQALLDKLGDAALPVYPYNLRRAQRLVSRANKHDPRVEYQTPTAETLVVARASGRRTWYYVQLAAGTSSPGAYYGLAYDSGLWRGEWP